MVETSCLHLRTSYYFNWLSKGKQTPLCKSETWIFYSSLEFLESRFFRKEKGSCFTLSSAQYFSLNYLIKHIFSPQTTLLTDLYVRSLSQSPHADVTLVWLSLLHLGPGPWASLSLLSWSTASTAPTSPILNSHIYLLTLSLWAGQDRQLLQRCWFCT